MTELQIPLQPFGLAFHGREVPYVVDRDGRKPCRRRHELKVVLIERGTRRGHQMERAERRLAQYDRTHRSDRAVPNDVRSGLNVREAATSWLRTPVRSPRTRRTSVRLTSIGRFVVVLERTRVRLRERTVAPMAGRLQDLLATTPERRQLVVRDGGRTVVILHDDILGSKRRATARGHECGAVLQRSESRSW